MIKAGDRFSILPLELYFPCGAPLSDIRGGAIPQYCVGIVRRRGPISSVLGAVLRPNKARYCLGIASIFPQYLVSNTAVFGIHVAVFRYSAWTGTPGCACYLCAQCKATAKAICQCNRHLPMQQSAVRAGHGAGFCLRSLPPLPYHVSSLHSCMCHSSIGQCHRVQHQHGFIHKSFKFRCTTVIALL